MANKERSISYGQLMLLLGAFLLGAAATLIFENALAGGTTSFSTTALIGFVLSVLVSGASIVLAIAAIALGRSSEQAVIERSDESIRLQNEVFARTTDALQRIESSTGVTEKRIEDMISGRAGAISSRIARSVPGIVNRERLEENVRRSLLESVRDDSEESDAERKDRRKAEEKYRTAHDQLQLAITNSPGVQLKMLGHGNPMDEDRPFDGLYTIEGKQIAMSTFRPADIESFSPGAFAPAAAAALSRSDVDRYVVVFFHDGEDVLTDPRRESVKSALAPYRDEIQSNTLFLTASYDAIEAAAKAFVELASGKAGGDAQQVDEADGE